jgi:hypothetical protein
LETHGGIVIGMALFGIEKEICGYTTNHWVGSMSFQRITWVTYGFGSIIYLAGNGPPKISSPTIVPIPKLNGFGLIKRNRHKKAVYFMDTTMQAEVVHGFSFKEN